MTSIAQGFALLLGALVVATSPGCNRNPKTDATSGPGSSSPGASAVPAPVASGIPVDMDAVSKVVNPKGESVYSGPAGAVRGLIVAAGDPAPEQPEILAKIPEECAPARELYGKLFREGPGRALADVLVAVTGYKGYIPEQRSIFEVQASGCAWHARTFALTFGQRLDVVAKDRRAYVPNLLGSIQPAQLVALPGGSSSTMYPQAPGRYALVDSVRLFTSANVIVLKYATHDVTGLDGRFNIERIPAGKVKLSVMLPATGAIVERDIEIQPSRTLDVKIELPFSLKDYEAALKAPPPGASAAPPRPQAAPSSPSPRPSGR